MSDMLDTTTKACFNVGMETHTTRNIEQVSFAHNGAISIENTGADEGPVVAVHRIIKQARKGYTTVTERWVISEVLGFTATDGSIKWNYRGVKLNADGSLDRRSISPKGGLKVSLLPFSRTAQATGEVRIPEASWVRAY